MIRSFSNHQIIKFSNKKNLFEERGLTVPPSGGGGGL